MGALEALNAGVTTLLDWSHINNTPEHADAAIRGLNDAGIRAVYAHGVPVGGDWWIVHMSIRKTSGASGSSILNLTISC